MHKIPVILIFDIGKTNKKAILFDKAYQPLREEETFIPEIRDGDGFPCEDQAALTGWIKTVFIRLLEDSRFDIRALNFSAYGASLVYIGRRGEVLTPIYNYLKPFPEPLATRFLEQYGPMERLCAETASPFLGSLNSGLQLYRLKHTRPDLFGKIKYALHLPQFASYTLTRMPATDISSVGCHSFLWNFLTNSYHKWVNQEGLLHLFPPIIPHEETAALELNDKKIICGFGLHDSSAALIPYLHSFPEPFLLLSTGTWSVSLNPFNSSILSAAELEQDCLCYLSYRGKPVKASRLFAGYEFSKQVERLSTHFLLSPDYFKTVSYNPELTDRSGSKTTGVLQGDLSRFPNFELAYHHLVQEIVDLQVESTRRVIGNPGVKTIYVDGGFSKNEVFMRLLANAFPGIKVYAASLAQGSALGAALALHDRWNGENIKENVIGLKYYPPSG